MRLLLVSFYFPPDLCAGSFRAESLVEQLLIRLPAGSHIDVVTSMPNRYKSYKASAAGLEENPGFNIIRVPVSSHQSGMVDQAKSYFQFAAGALKAARGNKYDGVVATSSRLMTAVLGGALARYLQAPLYLDIRDIFLDTVEDLFSKKIMFAVGPVLSAMERFAISSAYHVNLVSEGFLPYFEKRYHGRTFSLFTNGIDSEFLSAAPSKVSGHKKNGPIKVVYAGNFGEGQGLDQILPRLAKELEDSVEFVLIGDGGKKRLLAERLRGADVNNVTLHNPVDRQALIALYSDADVLFLHLNDYDAFRKVLPSKLFEYGALGKPVWAGVSGYASQFVKKYLDNAAVFSPCNVDEAIEAFFELTLHASPRPEFCDMFGRESIMERMADEIVSMFEKRGQ